MPATAALPPLFGDKRRKRLPGRNRTTDSTQNHPLVARVATTHPPHHHLSPSPWTTPKIKPDSSWNVEKKKKKAHRGSATIIRIITTLELIMATLMSLNLSSICLAGYTALRF